VIRGTLIQTGDRNTLDGNTENDGLGGPGYIFEDEVNWNSLKFSLAKRQQLVNLGYSTNSSVSSKHLLQKSVAMANDGPDTNGSQFFIITGESDDPIVKGLEGRHTVFGEVIEGWDVVLFINSVDVDDEASSSPKPIEDIRVLEVSIEID
jgi:cyclophilin family peptidyl-prolyl cis-trans isomerase